MATKTKSLTGKPAILKELQVIPGVGKSIAVDLYDLGYRKVSDLKGQDPQEMFDRSNKMRGVVQDRCLLYVFRCAVYFANEIGQDCPTPKVDKEKLKWWNWKG